MIHDLCCSLWFDFPIGTSYVFLIILHKQTKRYSVTVELLDLLLGFMLGFSCRNIKSLSRGFFWLAKYLKCYCIHACRWSLGRMVWRKFWTWAHFRTTKNRDWKASCPSSNLLLRRESSLPTRVELICSRWGVSPLLSENFLKFATCSTVLYHLNGWLLPA